MFDIHFIHDIGKVVVVHLSIYQKGIRLHTGIKCYQISDESAFSGPVCLIMYVLNDMFRIRNLVIQSIAGQKIKKSPGKKSSEIK